MKKSTTYKIGDRVVLPPKEGVTTNKRKGTVIGIFENFYLVMTDAGYRECIPKMQTTE